MQDEHMETIWRTFGGDVRGVVPLFETEIRGVPMLQRLGDALFTEGRRDRVEAELRPS